ncbi:hypothetical protein [Sphingopyxis sp.]|uniref:glucosamine inositolphosphorylceramide transferase family protein n=1 Tax=Sphingopyxis sp. TaxID=1908224 RepID=UPI001D2578D4|nr:hypothetical protein [Sphingopyxis sp.]MBW8295327.1 hypothetical protein [Sphingopyxis sp.]MBW8295330.1 hypothetical protein [Sphingopyxis sp.]
MQSEKASYPLRFVVLCDSMNFELWQANCMLEAVNSGSAIPVGIVFRDADTSSAPQNSWRRRWDTRQLALWRIFDRFYVRRFSRAARRISLENFFAEIPSCLDRPIKLGKFSEKLSEKALDFIRSVEPDFVLRFSYGILRGDVLNVAPYGVWSFHHGDPTLYRGQPPGFWEIFNASAVTGSILQVICNELDAGTVLHQGIFKTHASSYVKTRDTIYFGSQSWVRRTCAAIQANGWPQAAATERGKGPIYRQPTNKEMLHFLWKTVRKFCTNQITYRFYRQDWNVGTIDAPITVVAGLSGRELQSQALSSVHWMEPTQTGFYADPFGYEQDTDGSIRLFFETFDWRAGRGEIGTATYSNGRFGPVTTALSANTHLSYPFVIQEAGRPSFIPEHAAARDVSRFNTDSEGVAIAKTTIFPKSELIDTTFVNWDGITWAFATIEAETSNTHLYIYYANSMAGPWHAHLLNPVKTDVRSARPAGTPFVSEGRLYRPAQDCATHYGSAITINEIIKLSKTEFEEHIISRVAPVPYGGYAYGLHTISKVGGRTLIDGAKKSLRMPR